MYGYHKDSFVVSSEIRANLNRLRNEFRARAQEEPISLVMTKEGQKPGLLRQILHAGPQKMRVAFVNNRSPQVSGWTYWHELGKNRVETVFGDKVETRMVSDVEPDACQETLETLIREGSNIIFTTSPVLLDGAMKAAVKYPDVKILNCSLLPSYHTVRSYYLRMYEAKFIIGAIAGAVCDNNRIGYIADYPVYGAPASINAFALGARLTNPRAKVYLEWSTVAGADPLAKLIANDVYVISNRDISAPSHQSMEFGLYLRRGDGGTQNLAMPVWNWGRLYEDLLRRVQNGIWRTDATQNGVQALNYWWGMPENAIDVFYSGKLDSGTRRHDRPAAPPDPRRRAAPLRGDDPLAGRAAALLVRQGAHARRDHRHGLAGGQRHRRDPRRGRPQARGAAVRGAAGRAQRQGARHFRNLLDGAVVRWRVTHEDPAAVRRARPRACGTISIAAASRASRW